MKRFEVNVVEKRKYDNGVHIYDARDGTTHQMLDKGSAEDVCILLNELYEENQLLKREKECYKEKWQNQLKATNRYFEKYGDFE